MGFLHIVRQGECLSSITVKYGFRDWEVIYKHPDNAKFREVRPNPNLIYPGDALHIPSKETKYVSASSNARHTFKLKTPKTYLRIVLRDHVEGNVLAGKAYELKVGDRLFEGTVGSGGLIEQQIPETDTCAVLAVWLHEKGTGVSRKWSLRLGYLDPIESLSGVKARLRNLGFACGSIDDKMDPRTVAALRSFQKRYRLNVSGELDDATRSKLKSVSDNDAKEG